MRNCLVTKLKESVNNDRLLKEDEMIITVCSVANPTAQTQGIYIINSQCDFLLRVIGSGNYLTEDPSMQSGSNTLSLSRGDHTIYFLNGDYEVVINHKRDINRIGTIGGTSVAWAFKLDDLKYSLSLSSLSIINTKCTGSLSNLPATLSYLDLRGTTDIVGNLSELSHCTSLTDLYLNSTISGDISSLSTMTNLNKFHGNTKLIGVLSSLSTLVSLTYISLSNNKNVTGDISSLGTLVNLTELWLNEVSNIGGSFDDLVAAFRSNNKLSGEVKVPWVTYWYIDYKGNPVSQWSGTSDVNNKLVWTASDFELQ